MEGSGAPAPPDPIYIHAHRPPAPPPCSPRPPTDRRTAGHRRRRRGRLGHAGAGRHGHPLRRHRHPGGPRPQQRRRQVSGACPRPRSPLYNGRADRIRQLDDGSLRTGPRRQTAHDPGPGGGDPPRGAGRFGRAALRGQTGGRAGDRTRVGRGAQGAGGGGIHARSVTLPVHAPPLRAAAGPRRRRGHRGGHHDLGKPGGGLPFLPYRVPRGAGDSSRLPRTTTPSTSPRMRERSSRTPSSIRTVSGCEKGRRAGSASSSGRSRAAR